MKNKNKNFSPYSTYSLDKIDALKSKDKYVRGAKIVGKGDLRGGKTK